MRQNIVVIGDTHFGAHNNSMIWLRHQEDGFNEIIDYVEKSLQEYDETVVIHVGDLFDSRSSINPMVYKIVQGLLMTMNGLLNRYKNGSMYIIGGNHDYYYPWESNNNYSSSSMLPALAHITFVNDTCAVHDDLMMIPWFIFHNPIKLDNTLHIQRTQQTPFIIFTHTDPMHMSSELHRLVKGIPIVTGHIHQPLQDWNNGLLITGASYPMDFNDTNSERGFWTLQRDITDGQHGDISVEFHPIRSSIHFFTITESELRNWKSIGIRKDDHVEVQIRASHVDDYKDILKELNDNFNTNVMYITESRTMITENMEVLNADTVCQRLLPKKLTALYREMVEDCKGSSQ